MIAAEMSSCSGADGEEQRNKDKEGGGGRQEASLLLRRTTMTMGQIFLRKDVDDDDLRDQGNDSHATMFATPSASPATDADNNKDEDAREAKEDDGDDKMLGTNEVGCVGATPAGPTTPILFAREIDQGL